LALTPGTRLGPYEILSALGSGGMGEVYRARDTRLDRTVAIKILPEALAPDPQFRERFDREARAISQLTHPHICTLYDVGEQQGTAFLVMECLEGETLADRLKKGALPLDDSLKVAIQIADALSAAHRHGVVHRDLKPGNVMLTKAGAKLLDFGLAKASGPPIGGAGLSMLPTMQPNLTAQGTILGTLQYMAPEQLEGKEADERTDIFAFGAVLYELLTGTKAFSGTSHASLISSIMSSQPPSVSRMQMLAPADVPFLHGDFNESQGQFSPDGRWIAYVSDESGAQQVYVQSFPTLGGQRQISTEGGTQPQWRRDGKELFYLAPDRQLMAVTVKAGATFEHDAPRALFQTELNVAALRQSYAVSADGQRFC
jgi:serine/threonine protein kinase